MTMVAPLVVRVTIVIPIVVVVVVLVAIFNVLVEFGVVANVTVELLVIDMCDAVVIESLIGVVDFVVSVPWFVAVLPDVTVKTLAGGICVRIFADVNVNVLAAVMTALELLV